MRENLLVSLFPRLTDWAAHLMGIETTSNFIYFIGIVVLLVISFSFTVILSRQSQQIRRLIQRVSIENYLNEQKENGSL